MPTKYTVTVTSLGSSSFIVLPKPVVDGFNLGKGLRLEMTVRDDGIYIPLTEQPTDAATSNYSSPQRDGQVNESTKNGYVVRLFPRTAARDASTPLPPRVDSFILLNPII